MTALICVVASPLAVPVQCHARRQVLRRPVLQQRLLREGERTAAVHTHTHTHSVTLSLDTTASSHAGYPSPGVAVSMSSPTDCFCVWGQVGGVPAIEMNSLELEFLFSINFSLHVPADLYEKYNLELYNHVARPAVPCTCRTWRLAGLLLLKCTHNGCPVACHCCSCRTLVTHTMHLLLLPSSARCAAVITCLLSPLVSGLFFTLCESLAVPTPLSPTPHSGCVPASRHHVHHPAHPQATALPG